MMSRRRVHKLGGHRPSLVHKIKIIMDTSPAVIASGQEGCSWVIDGCRRRRSTRTRMMRGAAVVPAAVALYLYRALLDRHNESWMNSHKGNVFVLIKGPVEQTRQCNNGRDFANCIVKLQTPPETRQKRPAANSCSNRRPSKPHGHGHHKVTIGLLTTLSGVEGAVHVNHGITRLRCLQLHSSPAA